MIDRYRHIEEDAVDACANEQMNDANIYTNRNNTVTELFGECRWIMKVLHESTDPSKFVTIKHLTPSGQRSVRQGIYVRDFHQLPGTRCPQSMNAELLDPFAQDYPETLTASFNFGHATCLRFNHSGSHVAVGLVDGAVTIWDTATSGIARILKAHTRTVQSLWCVILTLL